ncbi:MAG: MCE family protein [Candidatus Omnitrophica bacterium]|nr:MCE family protein [Candidatus Omnitrophota bacterium]
MAQGADEEEPGKVTRMKQRFSLEMRVGAFVVLSAALLVAFLFFIGDWSDYFKPGYQLLVRFESANGIASGAPIQYAGVQVGKVERVGLSHDSSQLTPHVELTLKLPQDVRVRADDEASISTFGLLGEKYLEIRPGPGREPILKPGEMLIGKPPVSTERIIERSNEVLTELKSTLSGLNSLVGDPEARIYLSETLQASRDATRNWKLLGERLNLALSHAESGQGSLGKLLFDDELYQQALFFVEDLQKNPWKLLSRPKKPDK